MPRRSLLLPGLALAVATLLPGQVDAEARKPTFARVEDARGEPMADAVVTFVGGVPHVGVEAGPRDELQVQTDARGRVQAKLLPGLCYVAWAVGAAAADGTQASSPVQGWFGAGSLLLLRCGEAAAARQVRVVGAAAWQARGPLRFYAHTPTPGRDEPLRLADDGRLVLPVGPFETIEVRTADDVPLFHASAAVAELVVPPPRTLRVRARDENGAALPGATVRLRVGWFEPWRRDSLGSAVQERWRGLGVTGADGGLDAEVPYAADPLVETNHGPLLLFAAAPGRPAVAGGVTRDELFIDDRKVAKTARSELPFTLRRVAPLRGSVGRVPAGTVVHLATVCKLFLERQSYGHDTRSFVVPVADDGTFSCDVPADLHSCRFSLVTPSGTVADLPLFPSLKGRELPGEVQGAPPALLHSQDFAELTLSVLEATGGPARGLIALLTPAAESGVLVRDSTIRFPLDSRGTARLRLLPGPWVITAWTETGWVAKVLVAKAGLASETLMMQPHQYFRLRLADADGRPIVGARVQLRGTTTRGTNDPLQSILQSLRKQWITGWDGLATDAEGRIAIPFVQVEGVQQKLALQWDSGSTGDLLLEATDDWVPVVPR